MYAGVFSTDYHHELSPMGEVSVSIGLLLLVITLHPKLGVDDADPYSTLGKQSQGFLFLLLFFIFITMTDHR